MFPKVVFSRRFYLLTLANIFSKLGNSLSEIAIPLFVYQITGSAVATASVVAIAQLPNVLVGLASGPFIDKFSPRTVSMCCDGLNALTIMLIPLLFSVELLDTTILTLLVVLSKAIDVPGETAKQVLLPQIIKRDKLPQEKANGITAMTDNLADLLGPAIAGILIATIGALYVLVIDAATFALAVGLIYFGLRCHTKTDAAIKAKNAKSSFKQSWVYLRQHKGVWRLAVYSMLINIVACALLQLTLQVISQQYSINEAWLGFWFSAFAVGTSLTSIAYTFIGHRLSHLRLLQLTPIGQVFGLSVIFGAVLFSERLTATLPFLAEIWPVLIALGMFVYGVNLGVGSVIDNTLLQKWVPEPIQGTVFSIYTSLRWAGVPLGTMMAGYFLQRAETAWLFICFTILLFLAGFVWPKNKSFTAIEAAETTR
ncbi:MFS transporter [Veronia nyctiphanis]|nr:MFS transporter [Veronia nyctiphanis]